VLTILMTALLAQAASVLAPVADARQLQIAGPTVIAEIDTKKVQGVPVGLAWNTNGTLYLRVQAKDKARHYQIATTPELSLGQIDQLPQWAATYWTWKGAVVAPGDPALKLEVEQRTVRTRSVNTPSGGEIAGMSSAALPGGSGGEGVGDAVAMNAANNSMAGQVVTLRFKGHVVGEWTNEAPQPGMRISWAPAPMGLLAYCDTGGGVQIADRDGHRVRVPGTKNAILPAWSVDGQQIVFLQKKSDTLYILMVARVH
jgi:hypothetical protein